MRTRVGYAGGTKESPTYRDLGDHTESFEVDFDPTVIGYDEIVAVFWQAHNPCRGAYSTQYANILFWRTEEQKRIAEASLQRVRAEHPAREVRTAVRQLDRFWLAEDYHQKWTLRRHKALAAELLAIYPDWRDFANSTVAMRLNAWLDGAGTREQIEREIDLLGLSEAGRERVRAMIPKQRR